MSNREAMRVEAEAQAARLSEMDPDDRAVYMETLKSSLANCNICTECWVGDRRCQCWNDE